MIRHFAIATFRNMAANRLLSFISIAGLAVGIAVALLSGLVIRNQLSFDQFISGHQRIFVLAYDDNRLAGTPNPCLCSHLSHDNAAFFTPRIPEIQDTTRVYLTGQPPLKPPTRLRHGSVESDEVIYWADPNLFELLPIPVLHGDLSTALRRPDGIVLPKAMAEKYFGRDDVLGQVISVDGHPMVVRAVIHDLPSRGTTLQSGIFASSLSPRSQLIPPGMVAGTLEARARTPIAGAVTYWRFKPGTDLAVLAKRFAELNMQRSANRLEPFRLLPLDQLNLFEKFNPGIRARLAMAAAIGAAVLLIAVFNFISLMTVTAARREKEIGVRKACGAGRPALIGQFLGEAMLAVILGACIALALAEWLLAPLNAFLQTGARLDYGSEPLLTPALLLAVIGLGLLAGAYPAFLLSAFRPATNLRGWTKSGEAAAPQSVRGLLVALQFAILVVLGIVTITFWRQHQYAVRDAMGVDGRQVLLLRVESPLAKPGSQKIPPMFVTTMDNPRACPNALVERLRALRGVRQAMCSGDVFLKGNMGISWYATPTTPAAVVPMQIDPALFSFYGVKAVIGDLADAQHGIVLNQAAVKLLGFASPADAIGKSWMKPQSLREVWQPEGPIAAPDAPQSRVVAVVEDFGFEPVSQAVRPAIFSAQLTGTRSRLVHVRLTGDAVPQTLAAIDRLWRLTGQTSTPDRFFLDDYMKQQYVDIERQAQLFTLISAIAIFMACLGLVGIAAATADRRTKEVGVRKAMGATTSRIVGLMLWQFSLPVLLGSLVAWPLAFWLMQRWLAGFAYHTDLQWWMFAAASLGALLVALLTVAGQAWLAARQKPVLALRYE